MTSNQQLSNLRCQRIFAFILLVLLALPAAARVHDQKVSILLPTSFKKMYAYYFLYGSFGASGEATDKKPDPPILEISPFVEKKLAVELKLFIWIPGCQIEKFDFKIVKDVNVVDTFNCKPLPTVRLTGLIADPQLLNKKPAEVHVDYLASWACVFFGLADCMVPQAPLGTVKPDADGVFQIDLPDFAVDPGFRDSIDGVEFQFALRETETWNVAAFLQPEIQELRTPDHNLKSVSTYPQPVLFVEPTPRQGITGIN